MPLTNCPTCKARISTNARTCPKCGDPSPRPIRIGRADNDDPWYFTFKGCVGIAFLVLMAFSVMMLLTDQEYRTSFLEIMRFLGGAP